jgi:hypothetical protein
VANCSLLLRKTAKHVKKFPTEPKTHRKISTMAATRTLVSDPKSVVPFTFCSPREVLLEQFPLVRFNPGIILSAQARYLLKHFSISELLEEVLPPYSNCNHDRIYSDGFED